MSPLCVGWLFFSYAFAHLELQVAGFLVGVDDDVIAVENFAVENLQRKRILDKLLNRTFQRTRAEVRVVTLGEEQVLRRVGEFQRNLAVGEQAANVFQAEFDDLDQLLFAQRAEDDDVVDAVQEPRA